MVQYLISNVINLKCSKVISFNPTNNYNLIDESMLFIYSMDMDTRHIPCRPPFGLEREGLLLEPDMQTLCTHVQCTYCTATTQVQYTTTSCHTKYQHPLLTHLIPCMFLSILPDATTLIPCHPPVPLHLHNAAHAVHLSLHVSYAYDTRTPHTRPPTHAC